MILKKEITSHFLITLIWLGGLTVLKLIFNLKSFLVYPGVFSWFLFWLGALIGTMVLDLDQLIYALLISPEEKAKELWQRKKIKELLIYLADTSSSRFRLPFHNIVFQVLFMIFSFLILTSTASFLGKGLVMAMNLHLLKDEIHLLLKGKEEQLRTWLFWPIKREVSPEEQRIFLGLMGLLFLWLNFLL
ncbi:MAG: hypothetical protein ACPLKP_03015 [Microgenomates group bacterium]